MGNWAKKAIILHGEQPDVVKRETKEHTFFEIPVNVGVKFKLDVARAINAKATEIRVYWVCQTSDNYGSNKWRNWDIGNAEKPLHVLLNDLSKKQIEEGETRAFTRENVKGVDKKYVEGYVIPKGKSIDKAKLRNLVFQYSGDKVGEGLWLEIINYVPQFGKQGAFIIPVDEPQITSFYVEKRTISEKKTRAAGVKEEDSDTVEGNLIYGDILNLHLRLHNVFNYKAGIDIFCGDKNMSKNSNEPLKSITLGQYMNKDNPSLDYNLKILDELIVDYRWAEKSEHEIGENNQDSLQEFKLVLTLEPITPSENKPILTREATFTVNYTENFSPDEHEPEYKAQVVKVKQTPLVSQNFEMCKYTELKLTLEGEEPVIVLQEKKNGALVEMVKDNKTPYYEFVADKNKKLTIDVNSNVESCMDEISHKKNVIKVDEIITKTVKSSLFGEITPIEVERPVTENQLNLKIAYPYEADNDIELFKKYIFGGKPLIFWIPVQSCRYKRTPSIKIYPGIEWILKLSVGSVKPEVYSYTNMKGSSRTKVHNARARTAAINRKSKSQEVVFEVKLDAKYNGKPNPIINASYEDKIKKVLEAIVFIKDTMDNLTGVTSAKKGMAAKLGGKLLKSPFTFQLDYPVISIVGAWNYGNMEPGVVKRQGTITFGFTPLIKGTGKIDLITAAEFIPVVGQILKAADLALLVVGVEIYFNMYAFGEINLKGKIEFNKDDNFSLNSDTTLGIGVELGVKAEASTKRLTFAAEKTREEKVVGFELAAKGETSIAIGGSAGHDKKGPYIGLDATFNGITVFVTARAQVYKVSAGPKDKPYLLVRPKKDLYKNRWYLLDNN